MKRIVSIFIIGLLMTANVVWAVAGKNPVVHEIISYFEVPLVCCSAPEIGCGSRVKPLFIETATIPLLRESWMNREGTIIAFVWDHAVNESTIESTLLPVFKKYDIDAKMITERDKMSQIRSTFKQKGKWYRDMEVDLLSEEEAGIIAEDLTGWAKEKKLLNESEAATIKSEIENYFKIELKVVRSFEELMSNKTQNKWMDDCYAIFEKYVGKKRADGIKKQFQKNGKEQRKNSCCRKPGS